MDINQQDVPALFTPRVGLRHSSAKSPSLPLRPTCGLMLINALFSRGRGAASLILPLGPESSSEALLCCGLAIATNKSLPSKDNLLYSVPLKMSPSSAKTFQPPPFNASYLGTGDMSPSEQKAGSLPLQMDEQMSSEQVKNITYCQMATMAAEVRKPGLGAGQPGGKSARSACTGSELSCQRSGRAAHNHQELKL